MLQLPLIITYGTWNTDAELCHNRGAAFELSAYVPNQCGQSTIRFAASSKTCKFVNSIHTYNIIHKYCVKTFREMVAKPKNEWIVIHITFQAFFFLGTYKANYKDWVETKPEMVYTNYTWDLDRHGCQVSASFLLLRAFNYTICWLHGHWVSGMGFIVSIPILAVFASEWREELLQNWESQSWQVTRVRQPPSSLSQQINPTTPVLHQLQRSENSEISLYLYLCWGIYRFLGRNASPSTIVLPLPFSVRILPCVMPTR